MKLHNIILVTALILFTSCSVMCNKKNKLTGTRWTCEFNVFVADAGNEANTVTLSFVSAKKYTITTRRVLPPYPAMRMNADGTVDMKPGYDFEYTEEGTYSVKNGVITLTPENGAPTTFHIVLGKLKTEDLYYEPLFFSQEK